ncbi:DUF3667 domain-containing protein [Salinibacter altiplanensis]|uniref:DUF3667 domain-containing protein n=1 Tax=Salinibacter altiplanensis TaxID=1803181 RepID=UPI00131A5031|nr:DUF3667 domain-containing protein [Salinibacter altiplanensis]
MAEPSEQGDVSRDGSSPESSKPEPSKQESSKQKSSGASPPLARTAECSNCGRRFVGNYCPSCGQEADPPGSVLEVLSVFFRELIDIEGGLWATLRALSVHPGQALASYLGGARQRLMHPGRYLLAAIVVAFGTRQVFTWLGMREAYDERVSASFSESGAEETSSKTTSPEMANEIQSLMVSMADLVLESQWFLIATNLLLAVLLGLTAWRLFRDQFERLPQAVAFSAFVVAHTVFLETAAEALYVPFRYLSAGPAAGLSVDIAALITTVYVVIATVSTFGGGWWGGAKGLLALGWAAFEQMLILGMVASGYATWLIYGPLEGGMPMGGEFRYSSGDATAVAIGILPAVALCVVPLLLHLGLELYYRRG